MRALLWAAVAAILVTTAAQSADDVLVLDGKPHVFQVTAGDTTEILTTGNGSFDLDFDDDGDCDVSRIVGFGIKTAVASADSIEYCLAGSSSPSYHKTWWPGSSTDMVGLKIDNIRNLGDATKVFDVDLSAGSNIPFYIFYEK